MATSAVVKSLSMEDVTTALSVNKVFLAIQTKGSFEQNSTYHGNRKRGVFMPPPIDAKGKGRQSDEVPKVDQSSSSSNLDLQESVLLQSMLTAIASGLGIHVNSKWMTVAGQTADIASVLNKIAESEKCSIYVIHKTNGVKAPYSSYGDFPVSISIQQATSMYHVFAKKGDSNKDLLKSHGYFAVLSGAQLKKEKIKELHDMAVSCDIPLENGGKKKLKADLVNDIESYFKKLNTTLLD